MGPLLLVWRLAVTDLRRRPAQAILLVLAIAAGAATLTLGLAVRGTTDNPYTRTREATNGPDVVATVLTGGSAPGPATVGAPGGAGPIQAQDTALLPLRHAPGVAASSGPFPVTWTLLRHGATTGSAEVEGRDTTPSSVDRPTLLQGGWVQPGGVVVEAGFASALGIHLADRLDLGDTTVTVRGIAVTAAIPSFPNTCANAEGCFLANSVASHLPGLVWATSGDTIRLAGILGPDAYFLNLKLNDPASAPAFADRHNGGDSPAAPYLLSWQNIRDGDAQTLSQVTTVLTAGSWLLALLAIASVTVLVGGRSAEQTRRVGLLKAVGGTPRLVAGALLFEQSMLALVAAAAGLLIGWLTAPLIDNPGAGLLGAAGPPSMNLTTVAAVAALALGVAVAATVVPALRAARLSTVAALNDSARAPRRRPAVLRVSAHLPAPLLVGARLVARRPRRLLLNICSIAVTVSGLVALLIVRATSAAQAPQWALGPAVTQAMTTISVMLIILACVNATVISWTTALDARKAAALTRAMGATRQQLTAGLCAAQTLPALAGALLGIPAGIALYDLAASNTGPTALPPALSLVALILGTLLVLGVLSAVASRLNIRQPIAEQLRAGTG